MPTNETQAKRALIDLRQDSRFIFLGLIGLILIIGSKWPAVETWLVDIVGTWLPPLIHNVGIALFVGTITAYIISKWSESRLISIVEQSHETFVENFQSTMSTMSEFQKANIAAIGKEIFHGVLGTIVDERIYDVFKGTVIQCPVYRDQQIIRYKLKKHGEYVICNTSTEYYLKDTQSREVTWSVTCGVYTKEMKGFEKECKILSFMVDDKKFSEEEINKMTKTKDDGFLTLKHEIALARNSATYVSYTTSSYKRLEDTETHQVIVPATSLTLRVEAEGFDKIEIDQHIMTSHKIETGGDHAPPYACHWRVEGAFLPHQGISVTWRIP